MLKVLDFYKRNKITLNKVANILILPASLYIIVKRKKKICEFLINIPKKFCYSKIEEGFIKKDKLDEYSILRDFLIFSKELVLKKFRLSQQEYEELVLGLDLCAIYRYSNLNTLSKGFEIIKRFLIGSMRRLKDKWIST